MPQMSPINWLSLFFMFSLTFLMFNICNYFNFLSKNKKIEQENLTKKNYMNWKW